MEIITQESLAKNLVKRILGDLWAEYENDLFAHETAESFDMYIWNRKDELGQAAYEAIGEMYGGDLDIAINEVM